jgi:hypothetical protein
MSERVNTQMADALMRAIAGSAYKRVEPECKVFPPEEAEDVSSSEQAEGGE